MIKNFQDKQPMIHKTCYISESVDIIGEVIIGENTNIWFGTTIRADGSEITIGKNTNIQENSVVHIDGDIGAHIGNNVTIGHRAIIHACDIADNVLVGMGAIVLTGAKIGKNTIVGAGSLVTQGKEFPEGVLLIGSPARVVRELTEAEIVKIQTSADEYVKLSKKYL